MFDKSNIYDLLPSVPIASCSLLNTQNPGNAYHKDPLKSSALLAFNENLLYYNRESMSTPLCPDSQRKSSQFTTPKPIFDIPIKDKKSVKRCRDFPAIFFNEKEKQCRSLKNFIRTKHLSFKIKFKYNFVIFYVLLLCGTLKYGKYVNVNSCEPAAVGGNLEERSLNLCYTLVPSRLFENRQTRCGRGDSTPGPRPLQNQGEQHGTI
jgi:hypothetical protein